MKRRFRSSDLRKIIRELNPTIHDDERLLREGLPLSGRLSDVLELLLASAPIEIRWIGVPLWTKRVINTFSPTVLRATPAHLEFWRPNPSSEFLHGKHSPRKAASPLLSPMYVLDAVCRRSRVLKCG